MATSDIGRPAPPIPSALPLAQRVAGGGAIWLLGRILIGGLFLMSGTQKLVGLDQFAAALVQGGIPESMAAVLAPIAAVAETLGALGILLGVATGWASLLLIVFVIIGTFVSHRFWEFDGAVGQLQWFNFLKNAMLVGAFCLLYVAGGGPYSLDRWMRRRLAPRS